MTPSADAACWGGEGEKEEEERLEGERRRGEEEEERGGFRDADLEQAQRRVLIADFCLKLGEAEPGYRGIKRVRVESANIGDQQVQQHRACTRTIKPRN